MSAEPSAPNRDLSLRGILSEWVREVVGIVGRLPRTFAKLVSLTGHPACMTVYCNSQGVPDMPNHRVQARSEKAVKEEAAAVPNAATTEAMKESRRGNLPQFDSVEDLFDDLHADD